MPVSIKGDVMSAAADGGGQRSQLTQRRKGRQAGEAAEGPTVVQEGLSVSSEDEVSTAEEQEQEQLLRREEAEDEHAVLTQQDDAEDEYANTFRKLTGYYGVDVPYRVAWNFTGVVVFFWASYGFWRYGHVFREWLRDLLTPHFPQLHPLIPGTVTTVILIGVAYYCFCYFLTVVGSVHTSIIQRQKISRQMVNSITNWPDVRNVLDLACGRGVLLASIALRLDKERAGGKVVGYDHWASRGDKGRFDAGSMAWTLKACASEGVGPTVTCKSGPLSKLPFPDKYFDHVLSGLNLSAATEHEPGSWEQVLREVGRVIKPQGRLIIWDIQNVRAYAQFLQQEGGWIDIQIMPGVTAFLEKTKYLLATRK